MEMSNDAEAQAATEAMNGTQFQGRALVVNEARPREERPRREFRDRGEFRGGDRRGGGYRRGEGEGMSNRDRF